MSLCEELGNRLVDIWEYPQRYPEGELVKVFAAWYQCMKDKAGIDLAEEERLMAFLKEQLELLRLPEEVKPWPQPCDMRSQEVRGQIFDDPQKAMIFSKSVDDAFKEAGIELEDNETFAVLVCVVPVSRYMSEVVGPSFLEAVSTMSSFTYLPRPDILEMMTETIVKGAEQS